MRPLGLTLLEVLGTLGVLALVPTLALPASMGLLTAYRAEREGWFTGGRVSMNEQLQLYGARLHGDAGYTLNSRSIDICLPEGGSVVCRPLSQTPEAVRKALISGGLDARTCNPSNNPLLCQGGSPFPPSAPYGGRPR